MMAKDEPKKQEPPKQAPAQPQHPAPQPHPAEHQPQHPQPAQEGSQMPGEGGKQSQTAHPGQKPGGQPQGQPEPVAAPFGVQGEDEGPHNPGVGEPGGPVGQASSKFARADDARHQFSPQPGPQPEPFKWTIDPDVKEPVPTIADEQRQRSLTLQGEGVKKWLEVHDDRKRIPGMMGPEGGIVKRQVPGVSPTSKAAAA